MSRTRTFLAIDASDETLRRAIQLIDQFRLTAQDVKWVVPQNLHWTLQFLGDVDDTELAAVCEGVAGAVRDLAPFLLEAHGTGAFPSPHRPRTLWLGAARGHEQMVQLQSATEGALAKLGFRVEDRRYVPHLTIGRAGRGRNVPALADLLAESSDYDGGTGVVEEVIVYGSELGSGGPKYHVIGRAPLGQQ